MQQSMIDRSDSIVVRNHAECQIRPAHATKMTHADGAGTSAVPVKVFSFGKPVRGGFMFESIPSTERSEQRAANQGSQGHVCTNQRSPAKTCSAHQQLHAQLGNSKQIEGTCKEIRIQCESTCRSDFKTFGQQKACICVKDT